MKVFTDSLDFAEQVLGIAPRPWQNRLSYSVEPVGLFKRIYTSRQVHVAVFESEWRWQYLLLVESAPHSQYDVLVGLCREGLPLPDGLLCAAGEGSGFHGFRDRPWAAPQGNVYLSAHMTPNRPVAHAGVGFIVLAALTVIQAIDSIPGLEGKAGIKWVNDILIDGAKVGGVLAHTQMEGENVTNAVLGIGLNVETTPELEPTPFVPKVGRLQDHTIESQACTRRAVLGRLIGILDRNYHDYLHGGYDKMYELYKRRSLVIGRRVTICADLPGPDVKKIAEGRIVDLSKDLALSVEGSENPVRKGRLILKQ